VTVPSPPSQSCISSYCHTHALASPTAVPVKGT